MTPIHVFFIMLVLIIIEADNGEWANSFMDVVRHQIGMGQIGNG